MPAHHFVVTTRRATLGGALAALGACAGCDLDRGPEASRPLPPAAPDDADSRLVATVTDELLGLAALVARTRLDHPGLVPATEHLRALHTAHLEALGAGAEVATEPTTGSRTARAALATLRTRERRARSLLLGWSVAAESGALARLLASMSAALAQQLAQWPTDPRAGT